MPVLVKVVHLREDKHKAPASTATSTPCPYSHPPFFPLAKNEPYPSQQALEVE